MAVDRFAIVVDGDYLHAALSWTLHRARRTREALALDYDACLGLLRDKATEIVKSELLRVYWHEATSQTGEHASLTTLAAKPRLKVVTTPAGAPPGSGAGAILLDLAQKHGLADVVLITGAAELCPTIDEAQGYGLAVHVVMLGAPGVAARDAAAKLQREADTFMEISDAEIMLKLHPSVPPTVEKDAGIEASRQFLERVVDQVMDDIEDAEIDRLLKEHKRGSLPRHIDRSLLVVAHRELGRELNGREKRYLRETFYDVALYEMGSDDAAGDNGIRAA